MTFFLPLVLLLQGLYDPSILKKSDEAFFPELAKFTVIMKIYEKNKYDKHYEIQCYMKGNRKYLAIIKNPPVARRTSHLRVGDKIWIYLGKINKTTEVSAKASFAESTFSEEDILSVSLGYFYNFESAVDVLYEQKKAIQINLKSPSKSTSYYRIENIIDAETLLPLARYYYSYSNQKIKEMKVNEIRKGKKIEYVKLTMYDVLKKGTYTEVEMKDFEFPANLDDKMFTKRYMELASE